jgi:predicted phage terminase large subunit-like protein
LIGDCWRFQTADLALSESEGSDYTVVDTWEVTPDNELLLIDSERFRAESPEVKKALISSRHGHQPDYQAIESAHYGIGVCQEWLRAGMPLRALKAATDKVTRSIQAQLMLENGRMYFAAGAPWLIDLETELLTFPVAAHDDQVDPISYAAIEIGNRAPGGLCGEGEQQEDEDSALPLDLGVENNR